MLLEATFRFTHSQTQINKTSGKNFLSVEVQGLFDCELKTFAPFHRKEYSDPYGKGDLVGTHVVEESQIQLRPISIGSMNEFMLSHACRLGNFIRSNKKELHKVSQTDITNAMPSLEDMSVFPKLECELNASSRLEVRARHIAINVFPRNTYAWINSNEKLEDFRAAYIKINNARKELEQGEKFELVWKKYSDLETAPINGDLGFFKRGVMVPEFEKIAFCLPVGTLSPVIKTFLGFHIVQITDVRN